MQREFQAKRDLEIELNKEQELQAKMMDLMSKRLESRI